MRRFLPPAALVAALALAACDSPTGPGPAPAPDVAPGRAMVFNDRIELFFVTVNGCNGETLSGTATQHIVVATTYDAARGTHLLVKSQISNLQMTGASGVSYVGGTEQTFNYTIRPVQPGVIVTESIRTRLIGQGGTPNRFMTFLSHYSVNANGEQTSYFSDFSIECR